MPTPTYIPLQTITLGSSASSVTFASIPQTHRDAVLVFNGGVSGDYETTIRFNGDSGSNYNSVNMRGDGSNDSSGSNASATYITFGLRNITVPSTSNTNVILNLMDYSATDKQKSLLQRVNDASKQTFAQAGRWASTTAISSIELAVSGGTFNAGSTFSLYAIEA